VQCKSTLGMPPTTRAIPFVGATPRREGDVKSVRVISN